MGFGGQTAVFHKKAKTTKDRAAARVRRQGQAAQTRKRWLGKEEGDGPIANLGWKQSRRVDGAGHAQGRSLATPTRPRARLVLRSTSCGPATSQDTPTAPSPPLYPRRGPRPRRGLNTEFEASPPSAHPRSASAAATAVVAQVRPTGESAEARRVCPRSRHRANIEDRVASSDDCAAVFNAKALVMSHASRKIVVLRAPCPVCSRGRHRTQQSEAGAAAAPRRSRGHQ